ncbi:MAG: permease-like cell division protein FtsX [Elusimicrobiaceae bacterium]
MNGTQGKNHLNPESNIAGNAPAHPAGFFARAHRDLTRVVWRGYRIVFLLAMCVCLLGETVLFFSGQVKLISAVLRDDFKIILTVDESFPETGIKELEDKLYAVQGVTYAKYVSKNESFETVRSEDPELARTILTFGQNPLPRMITIKASDNALSNAGSWLKTNIVDKMQGISGVSYNPEQIYAILQADFYDGLLSLVLALAAIAILLLAFFVELSAAKHIPFLHKPRQSLGWMFSGFLGASAAWAVMLALVYPMKHLSPMWWSFPVLWRQMLVLLCGAILGWSMFRWKETR